MCVGKTLSSLSIIRYSRRLGALGEGGGHSFAKQQHYIYTRVHANPQKTSIIVRVTYPLGLAKAQKTKLSWAVSRVARHRHSLYHTHYSCSFTSTLPLLQLKVIAPVLPASSFLSFRPQGCILPSVHFRLSTSSLLRCTSAFIKRGSIFIGN